MISISLCAHTNGYEIAPSANRSHGRRQEVRIALTRTNTNPHPPDYLTTHCANFSPVGLADDYGPIHPDKIPVGPERNPFDDPFPGRAIIILSQPAPHSGPMPSGEMRCDSSPLNIFSPVVAARDH